MNSLIMQPTSTAQWYALVNEAEYACSLQLSEDLESYLVFLLIRFTEKPELAKSILALEFLHSFHTLGQHRSNILKDVGDKCLLLAGLFPEHAKRRRVSERYYMDIGQSAYDILSYSTDQEFSHLYQLLCEYFQTLRNVLYAMRQQHGDIADIWNRFTEKYKN